MTRESEYQVLFEYYKDIQAIALKAYISSQLSYMVLSLHESGNFRGLSVAYRERFIEKNFEIKDLFKENLAKARADVIKCVSVNDQSNIQKNILYILL